MGDAAVSTDSPSASSLPLDGPARVLYDAYADQFAADLLLSANEIAHSEHRRLIWPDHVQRAREVVCLRFRPRTRREFALLAGGAMLGAGMENALTELLEGRYGGPLWFYLALGLAGFVLAAIGLLAL